MYIYIIKQTEKHTTMKNLLNKKLTENQISDLWGYAENEDGEYTISSIKKAMREVFMQAGLIEKERIDFSKMSVRELHGYAHEGETYDHLSRSYK